MRIEDDVKLDYDDVLIRPKRSKLFSREEVNLNRHFARFPHSEYEWSGVPIIASNMDSIGTFELFNVLKEKQLLTCIHKHYTKEQWFDQYDNLGRADQQFIIPSIGSSLDEMDKLDSILGVYKHIKMICLDIANGYSEHFLRTIERARKRYKRMIIIAGNVASAEMTEALILAGADIVKVGIGPGSVCTTRKVTGVGYPQLSAVIECADAAHGLNGHIIADGGCVVPGDIAKAFGGGADFVMLGGMFAGHDETRMSFYGMSSAQAQSVHNGGMKDYRAPEGKSVMIPARGPIDGTLQEILGGLRSSCTYVGASQLKHLPKCTTFVRVNKQLNTSMDKYE